MWNLISVMQLEQERKEQTPMLLIDLREAKDYESGHIPGALHIPEEILSEYLIQVPEDCRIILICYRGPRSIREARRLSDCGYHVSAVCGGMEAWRRWEESDFFQGCR